MKNGTRYLGFTEWVVYSSLSLGVPCTYCNERKADTWDHVVPKRLRGSDRWDNLVPACQSCNSSKGRKPLYEFRARLKSKGAYYEFELPDNEELIARIEVYLLRGGSFMEGRSYRILFGDPKCLKMSDDHDEFFKGRLLRHIYTHYSDQYLLTLSPYPDSKFWEEAYLTRSRKEEALRRLRYPPKWPSPETPLLWGAPLSLTDDESGSDSAANNQNENTIRPDIHNDTSKIGPKVYEEVFKNG